MADPAGVWRRRRRIHGGLWWRNHDGPRPDVSGTSPPPSLVASNSLFGTFGNLSGATVTHALKRRIKYSLGLKLGLVSVPGTALGALLAQHAESDLFKILLGSILAVSAYMLFRGKMKEGDSRSTRLMPVMMTIASIFAGTVSSFFGIGGGVVIVPFMIPVMGMKIKEVAISSQPALLVIAFVGLAVHGLLGHPDLYQATYLLVGEFSGGLLGVRLSQRLGGRHLQIILSALIATAAIRLFWESLEEAYRGDPLFALHVLLSGTAGSAPPPCSQAAGAEQAGPFEGARRSACPDAPRDGMKACTDIGQNRQQAMQARMFLAA